MTYPCRSNTGARIVNTMKAKLSVLNKILWKCMSNDQVRTTIFVFHTNRTKTFFPDFSRLENDQILYNTIPDSVETLYTNFWMDFCKLLANFLVSLSYQISYLRIFRFVMTPTPKQTFWKMFEKSANLELTINLKRFNYCIHLKTLSEFKVSRRKSKIFLW